MTISSSHKARAVMLWRISREDPRRRSEAKLLVHYLSRAKRGRTI